MTFFEMCCFELLNNPSSLKFFQDWADAHDCTLDETLHIFLGGDDDDE